ncbi:hypothetical protein FA95DRAFT_519752 [Auriscalpium vulgare]|uniref:Uncharacterized protein n=1 Tax=Auriscalpium vulgare TaxID=40419 RepID=A0ACB8S363_9AGAM|nr:hypothetical protein FA95DRAFT_519752 [Auriscalpium vulgare]
MGGSLAARLGVRACARRVLRHRWVGPPAIFVACRPKTRPSVAHLAMLFQPIAPSYTRRVQHASSCGASSTRVMSHLRLAVVTDAEGCAGRLLRAGFYPFPFQGEWSDGAWGCFAALLSSGRISSGRLSPSKRVCVSRPAARRGTKASALMKLRNGSRKVARRIRYVYSKIPPICSSGRHTLPLQIRPMEVELAGTKDSLCSGQRRLRTSRHLRKVRWYPSVPIVVLSRLPSINGGAAMTSSL